MNKVILWLAEKLVRLIIKTFLIKTHHLSKNPPSGIKKTKKGIES